MELQKTALVTGGNRGIGLEVCRQLAAAGIRVICSGRNLEKTQSAGAGIGQNQDNIIPICLDVNEIDSMPEVVKSIWDSHGPIDILVNNAGILIDADRTAAKADLALIRQTLETNLFGAMALTNVLLPMMKARNYGRIVNVSSRMGAFSHMDSNAPGYRISKVALNAFTSMIAAQVRDYNILVNTMSPGWVRTAMGGENAERSVEQGADTITWLAQLPDGADSGKFFGERSEIDW